jgi:hypothetical protein
MTKNNKGRSGGDRPTPKTTDSVNHTGSDPLIGCINLAKPTRTRQQKRSWKNGNQRGRIDTCLAGQLALLVVIALLFVGGVMP